jgi:hypothetical protein
MRKRLIGILAVVAAALACSEDKAAPDGSVTGRWCGIDVATAAACVGDEVFYVQLTQDGAAVTGTWCEDAEATDCNTIADGMFVGGTFTFGYDLAPSDRVDGSLTLSGDGDQLAGDLTTTKDGGHVVPVTLHRL